MHDTKQKIISALKKQGMICLELLKAGLLLLKKNINSLGLMLAKYGKEFCRLLIQAGKTTLRYGKKWAIVFRQQCRVAIIYCWRCLKKTARVSWYFLAGTSRKVFEYTANLAKRLFKYIAARQAPVRRHLYQYALLMRLDKPIGIFLLLWPALWALWIAADGKPDFRVLLIFVSGVVIMRSAGCVVNDLADRDLDPVVARTVARPLATGAVSVKEAVILALVLILFAFLLVLQLNPLTIKLSFIGIVLAIIYPFSKRFTYMPQFFLGMAFGWAIPMAFTAQTGTVTVVTWILFLATVLWAVVYDTMYAMVDREDDIKMGVKSTAILFDDADRSIIGVIQILVLLALVLIGNRMELGRIYYAGLAIAAVLFIYQQYLIRDRKPEHCFAAFLNNNLFGAAVFAGIFFNYQFS